MIDLPEQMQTLTVLWDTHDPGYSAVALSAAITATLGGIGFADRSLPETDFYVEGSVQRLGEAIRVTLRLCTSLSHRILDTWVRTYPASCEMPETEIADSMTDEISAYVSAMSGKPGAELRL
jgi:hypothetical protein